MPGLCVRGMVKGQINSCIKWVHSILRCYSTIQKKVVQLNNYTSEGGGGEVKYKFFESLLLSFPKIPISIDSVAQILSAPLSHNSRGKTIVTQNATPPNA